MASFDNGFQRTLGHEGGFNDNLKTGEIANMGWTNFTLAKLGLLPEELEGKDYYAKLKIGTLASTPPFYVLYPSGQVVDLEERTAVLTPVIKFIKGLTVTQVREWYLKYFWEPARLTEVINDQLGCKIFDVAVNQGEGWAILELQRAVNTLHMTTFPKPAIGEDGVMGPATLIAVNALPATELLSKFRWNAAARYRAIGGPNLNAWLARLAS